jgi:hypothetical protein
MAQESLTGYDNRDARSGKPDLEVYLYDSLTERLVCASCNPTGGRPTGVEVSQFENNRRPNLVDVVANPVYPGSGHADNWVAANLPPSNVLEGFGEALYQPRALSDGGRVFFNSGDALVPQDVNAQEDVYEFEPVGTGDCSVSSVTFESRSRGCVGLISSGVSSEESGFMDASESGGDVFFLTESRLTSRDHDTALDLYDAHECSVSAPCVAPPVVSPPCSSGDSCKAAPSPQPSIFGAPASATFAGAGNLVGSPSAAAVGPKSLTRAQRLVRAVAACRKKPERKRAACREQARKRYGVRGARKSARASGKGQG